MEAVERLERKALTGDKAAVIRLVSLERTLRAEIKKLLEGRRVHGSVDDHEFDAFESIIEIHMMELTSDV